TDGDSGLSCVDAGQHRPQWGPGPLRAAAGPEFLLDADLLQPAEPRLGVFLAAAVVAGDPAVHPAFLQGDPCGWLADGPLPDLGGFRGLPQRGGLASERRMTKARKPYGRAAKRAPERCLLR